MKNAYVKTLQKQKDKFSEGVKSGCELMCLVFLIALDNVAKTMFADRTVARLLKNTEEESQRVYDEVMDSVERGEHKDMSEMLIYYAEEIRRRRQMDGKTD